MPIPMMATQLRRPLLGGLGDLVLRAFPGTNLWFLFALIGNCFPRHLRQ